MSLLEVKDLHVHYGVIEALKGVSIKVEPGQIVTLIGANGAGKTSLMHAISGIVKKTGGEILFQDNSIYKSSPRSIVSSGLVQVPEGRHVFPGLSVYENLMMGAYLRKDKKNLPDDLKKVYERFPILEKRKNQDASTLPGPLQASAAHRRTALKHPGFFVFQELETVHRQIGRAHV